MARLLKAISLEDYLHIKESFKNLHEKLESFIGSEIFESCEMETKDQIRETKSSLIKLNSLEFEKEKEYVRAKELIAISEGKKK